MLLVVVCEGHLDSVAIFWIAARPAVETILAIAVWIGVDKWPRLLATEQMGAFTSDTVHVLEWLNESRRPIATFAALAFAATSKAVGPA